MTELMQKALDTLSRQPDTEQDNYSARLLKELEDERKWDEAFAKSPGPLERLAAEARTEIAASKTMPLTMECVIADD